MHPLVAAKNVAKHDLRTALSALVSFYRLTMWRIWGKVAKTVTVSTRKQGRLTVYTNDREIGKSIYCRRDFELGETMNDSANLNQATCANCKSATSPLTTFDPKAPPPS